MPVKIVDLSVSIENWLPSDPENMIPRVAYVDHEMGALQMEKFFPGITKEDLPGGMGWAIENVELTTHSGTHLDAPYHYHPTMSNGKRSLTIGELPLEWCFSDGVILDFSDKPDGYGIKAEDVETELNRINYKLKPMDIVLVHTGADEAWGSAEYLMKGAGMTRESTLYILEQDIKVVGIDAWSWDRPLGFQAKEFAKSKDPRVVWEAHFAGIEKGYCHLEKLTNLNAVGRPFGFKVACFPVKIKGASAGWTRAVAIIEDE